MSQPGALRTLWFKWKSLRLPWRRKWLCGHDLTGTTYWELRSQPNTTRPRRIAQPAGGRGARSIRSAVAASELRLPPAWLQWLRHTRATAPTLDEQVADVRRLASLRVLAARADERWRAGESLLEMPKAATETPTTSMGVGEGGEREQERMGGGKPAAPTTKTTTTGEGWQPQAWVPGVAERR